MTTTRTEQPRPWWDDPERVAEFLALEAEQRRHEQLVRWHDTAEAEAEATARAGAEVAWQCWDGDESGAWDEFEAAAYYGEQVEPGAWYDGPEDTLTGQATCTYRCY